MFEADVSASEEGLLLPQVVQCRTKLEQLEQHSETWERYVRQDRDL